MNNENLDTIIVKLNQAKKMELEIYLEYMSHNYNVAYHEKMLDWYDKNPDKVQYLRHSG